MSVFHPEALAPRKRCFLLGVGNPRTQLEIDRLAGSVADGGCSAMELVYPAGPRD
jgi:hypothetical protein